MGRVWPGVEGLVFWQKPLYKTTLCTKIHNLMSPSPLGDFRGKGKWLGQRFASRLCGKRRKSFRRSSQLSCFLPGAKDGVFVLQAAPTDFADSRRVATCAGA